MVEALSIIRRILLSSAICVKSKPSSSRRVICSKSNVSKLSALTSRIISNSFSKAAAKIAAKSSKSDSASGICADVNILLRPSEDAVSMRLRLSSSVQFNPEYTDTPLFIKSSPHIKLFSKIFIIRLQLNELQI